MPLFFTLLHSSSAKSRTDLQPYTSTTTSPLPVPITGKNPDSYRKLSDLHTRTNLVSLSEQSLRFR